MRPVFYTVETGSALTSRVTGAFWQSYTSRKNWLFAGSEAATHRTAILCSLVQTCKDVQINPFVYLRDVIERVWTHPARLVLELTPHEWKRLRLDSAAKAVA